MKTLLYVSALVLLLLTPLLSACSGGSPSTPAGSISTGQEVTVLSEAVDAAGGTIIVDQPGSPVDGLELVVPENAYDNSREYEISYRPVEEHSFGPEFNPVSPVVSIENGGGYSEEVLTLTIPVEVPEGHFAMAFYYDVEKGTLEGIPAISATDSSLTLVTRHFTDIIASSIDEMSLLDPEIDTGFFPGVDDWQFTNYGSYIAPGGHCAGQSVTALWYYTEMKAAGEPSLYGRFDEGTRDFWYDDAAAYRFASTIQRDIDWGAWEVRYHKLMEKVEGNKRLAWNQFVYAMMVTEQPQFVYIQNTGVGGAHAMVAYGVSGGALDIADPNYPDNHERTIWFDDGAFEPYESGANAQAILDGNSKAYDNVLYFGTSSLIDFSKIADRWGEMEEGTVGNDRFPSYIIQSVNEEGDLVDLKDGYATASKSIPIFLESSDSNLSFCVFRDGAIVNFSQKDGTYPLIPGNNQLGFYILAETGNPAKLTYVDFQYINIKCNQPTTTTGGKPVITSFDGPTVINFDATLSLTGTYTFSIEVEGGTPPYYYTWKGARMPQVLVEGEDYYQVTISPDDMRQPGGIGDGLFLWVTVKDSKNQHATWGGVGNTEFLYSLYFTGSFKDVDGVTVVAENTWEVRTEPESFD